jgi:hypothetical protein
VHAPTPENAPPGVTLAVQDRALRLAWLHALRQAGVAVRAATRPAELAKAQADDSRRLIVSTTDATDRQLVATVSASARVLEIDATTPLRDVLAHIHEALAG